ncbi:unnamed protein product [Prunus armeniaca]|uniref:Uncharacterized protein n=1 Tax=Prunus armeniaca TaxID=36596 RepID=A0A6J5TKW5_PRUAR|nr:unnamed protein product [Prunus armeniaca]CAB4294977.1 unnamed protein product [Prunus armeniaca]
MPCRFDGTVKSMQTITFLSIVDQGTDSRERREEKQQSKVSGSCPPGNNFNGARELRQELKAIRDCS